MPKITLTLNGKSFETDIESRTLLCHLLRDNARLTGTHIGCETSQCGACIVHVNGKAVKSCTMLAMQAEQSEITTIEGLSGDGKLHPVQEAFSEEHGLQCGFCTPGMIMAATDILTRHKNPDESLIRQELEGNICRCTGYQNIVKAIQSAAQKMAAGT